MTNISILIDASRLLNERYLHLANQFKKKPELLKNYILFVSLGNGHGIPAQLERFDMAFLEFRSEVELLYLGGEDNKLKRVAESLNLVFLEVTKGIGRESQHLDKYSIRGYNQFIKRLTECKELLESKTGFPDNHSSELLRHSNIFPNKEAEELFFHLGKEYVNPARGAKYSWIYHFMNRGGKDSIYPNQLAYLRFIKLEFKYKMSKVQPINDTYSLKEKTKLHNLEDSFKKRLSQKSKI